MSTQDQDLHQVILRWCAMPYNRVLPISAPLKFSLLLKNRPHTDATEVIVKGTFDQASLLVPCNFLFSFVFCFADACDNHWVFLSHSLLYHFLCTISLPTVVFLSSPLPQARWFRSPCLHSMERQDRVQVHRRWSLDDQRYRAHRD